MRSLLLGTSIVLRLLFIHTKNYSASTNLSDIPESYEPHGPYSARSSTSINYNAPETSSSLLVVVATSLLVSALIVSTTLWCISRKRQGPIDEEASVEKSPQKIDHEVIDLSEFQNRGPLVMQARMKGRIKHALDDDKSFSLKEIQFDSKHNEIVTIGSDVEQLEGMSQLSMLSAEKSAEMMKGKRKMSHPTMANEAKRREDEAKRLKKEAERVAENERRMAECAARRRAKEEAQIKVAQKTKRSDETVSEKTDSAEGQRNRSVGKTQRSSESTESRKEHEGPTPLPKFFEKKLSTPAGTAKSISVPVVARRKPSNDGARPDARGYKIERRFPTPASKPAALANKTPISGVMKDEYESSKSQKSTQSSRSSSSLTWPF